MNLFYSVVWLFVIFGIDRFFNVEELFFLEYKYCFFFIGSFKNNDNIINN